MKLIGLLPLLLCFSSFAQVNIIIEDKTETGFRLGVDGFIQNTDPVNNIAIQSLDTVPHQLFMELGPGITFTKIIHLRSKGNYKYIVTTNSRDELQLRYRGTLLSIPSEIKAISVQSVIPVPESEPVVTVSVSSNETMEIAEADTIKVTPVIPTKEIKETKVMAVAAITTDTLTKAPDEQASIVMASPEPMDSIVVNEVNPFDAFIMDLEETEFEFEKLQKSTSFAENHSFTLEELKQVFNVMTYDASRLQLLRTIKASQSDIRVFKSLAADLDYEISKQQFEEIISL